MSIVSIAVVSIAVVRIAVVRIAVVSIAVVSIAVASIAVASIAVASIAVASIAVSESRTTPPHVLLVTHACCLLLATPPYSTHPGCSRMCIWGIQGKALTRQLAAPRRLEARQPLTLELPTQPLRADGLQPWG